MTDSAEIRILRFDSTLELGDGRTIVGRVVPYNVPALVADELGVTYREQIAPGTFRRAVRAPNRVLLNYEHRTGILDQVARCTELVESDAGLDGVFRALDGVPGDQALELIRSGAVTGLSVQARIPPRTSRTLDDGTIERTLAVLEHVALVAEPAYAGAGVTAVRSSSSSRPLLEAVRARNAELRLRSRSTTDDPPR